MKYILNQQGEPVPEPDLHTWAIWFETARRRVKLTNLGHGRVSTVFLGLDHGFTGHPPLLWESMLFYTNGRADIMTRCGGSREQAIAMHAAFVRRVKRHKWPKQPSRKQALKARRRAIKSLQKFRWSFTTSKTHDPS